MEGDWKTPNGAAVDPDTQFGIQRLLKSGGAEYAQPSEIESQRSVCHQKVINEVNVRAVRIVRPECAQNSLIGPK
jgi:hypothetical protein